MAICAAALASSSILGTWKGHISLAPPPTSAKLTPQQQSLMKTRMAMVEKIVITMTFNKDGSFSEIDTARKQKQIGSWKQSGNQVTITETDNGKPHSVTMALAKNGKAMSLRLGRNSVTFKRV